MHTQAIVNSIKKTLTFLKISLDILLSRPLRTDDMSRKQEKIYSSGFEESFKAFPNVEKALNFLPSQKKKSSEENTFPFQQMATNV